MESADELVKVSNFIADCDDLIAGKFIFGEYKISKIIKDIGESKQLYTLFSNAVTNFNFDREFSRARYTPNKFVLPDEQDKALALIFCLLVDINNKKISLEKFLRECFFADGDSAGQFSRFGKEVMQPFKDMISACLEIQKKEQETKKEQEEQPNTKLEENIEMQVEESVEQNKFFEEILSTANQMLEEMEFDHKTKSEIKEDAEYLLQALIVACERQDFKYTSALIVGIEYVALNMKSAKFLAKELKNILIRYYA